MSVTANPGATYCPNFDDSDTVVEFEIPFFPIDKLLNRIQGALLRSKEAFKLLKLQIGSGSETKRLSFSLQGSLWSYWSDVRVLRKFIQFLNLKANFFHLSFSCIIGISWFSFLVMSTHSNFILCLNSKKRCLHGSHRTN